MKKKIFVIEDDEIIRDNLETLLSLENFEVYSSENGKEGIKLSKGIKPDLIICDVMLPDMTGYDIIKVIRNISELKNIPFIFLTARAEMKDLREGMNLGADDYLTKPYDAKELIEVINTRIKLKEKQSAAPDKNKQTLSLDEPYFINTPKQVKSIFLKNVVCIFGDAEYSKLIMNDGEKITIRKLIKEWEETLPNTFMRVHKSTIINLNYLKKIDKWFNSSFKIELNNHPEEIISSRRYSTKLREKFFT